MNTETVGFSFVINCEKCTNRELMSSRFLLAYQPPMNYPLDVPTDNIVLNPKEMTFDSLKKCISIANKNRVMERGQTIM